MSRTAARAARRINNQLRRLRAGLEAARETMAIHFGEDDEAVRRADRALRGDVPLELEPVRVSRQLNGPFNPDMEVKHDPSFKYATQGGYQL